MCGICGFLQFEKEADERILKKMNDQIVHRGPDDDGFFQQQGIGLAVRRLSIIDLFWPSTPVLAIGQFLDRL